MNSIGLNMNLCGKILAAPAEIKSRLRLSNFFLVKILRFTS